MSINKKIKDLRKKKGLTQKDSAEILNMARSTYSKIETGNTEINYKILLSISKMLDVPVNEIIKEAGDPVAESIAIDLGDMLLQTQYWLSEKLYRAIPYKKLKPIHKQLLKEKGLDSQEIYEDTPIGGRIYEFGPTHVFNLNSG